jgi:ADP-ribose pyrophosphatase YjhB (NUDIX family)
MTEMECRKKRRASRLILIDSDGRILLFRHLRKNGETFWAPPGGGLNEGETFEQAAQREAAEEMGINALTLILLWERITEFVYIDTPVLQQERFFLVEGDFAPLLRDVQEVHRQESILEARWWKLCDLKSAPEPVFPEELGDQLKKHLN